MMKTLLISALVAIAATLPTATYAHSPMSEPPIIINGAEYYDKIIKFPASAAEYLTGLCDGLRRNHKPPAPKEMWVGNFHCTQD